MEFEDSEDDQGDSISEAQFSREQILSADALATEKLNSLLFEAATRNQIDRCLALIDAGADIDSMNRNGRTPLMACARFNYWELATILIAKGACLLLTDIDEVSALQVAEVEGSSETFNVIGSAIVRDHINNDAGHYDNTFEKYSPEVLAVKAGNYALFSTLFYDYKRNRAYDEICLEPDEYEESLWIAAERGNHDICRLLLEEGIRPQSSAMLVFCVNPAECVPHIFGSKAFTVLLGRQAITVELSHPRYQEIVAAVREQQEQSEIQRLIWPEEESPF